MSHIDRCCDDPTCPGVKLPTDTPAPLDPAAIAAKYEANAGSWEGALLVTPDDEWLARKAAEARHIARALRLMTEVRETWHFVSFDVGQRVAAFPTDTAANDFLRRHLRENRLDFLPAIIEQKEVVMRAATPDARDGAK